MAKDECTLSDIELIDKVNSEITKLCESGGKSFVMHVPARVNEDLDLLVAEMSKRFHNLIKKQEGHQLALADAQFVGFKAGFWDEDVIPLVVTMGLTAEEWEQYKKEYDTVLDDKSVSQIDAHFLREG